MNELLARWIEPAGGEWGHGERLSRSLPRGKNQGKKFFGTPLCGETICDHRLRSSKR